MLTNFLVSVAESEKNVSTIPGVVYMVGASFEFCNPDHHSDGPRLAQWLAMYLGHNSHVLVTDGEPGDTFNEFTINIDDEIAERTNTGTDTQMIDAAILALTGQALTDTSFTGLNQAVTLVPKLKTISDTVIALDYPPLEGKTVPFLTEFLGVDQVWWDETWRPAYRTAMQNAGAIIVNAHFDWQPDNRIPGPNGYPGWHISSVTSKRAAKRIYNYLMSNTSLGSK